MSDHTNLSWFLLDMELPLISSDMLSGQTRAKLDRYITDLLATVEKEVWSRKEGWVREKETNECSPLNDSPLALIC